MGDQSTPAKTCIGFVNVDDLETYFKIARTEGVESAMRFYDKEKTEGKVIVIPFGSKFNVVATNFPVTFPYNGEVMVNTITLVDQPGQRYYMPERIR
jgi:hypothetical protein